MTWSSDQLPWTNFKYSKPPRPTGQYEPLNYLTGPSPLNRSPRFTGLSGPPVMLPGRLSSDILAALQLKPPVIYGKGLRPYYPNRTTLTYQYNAPVMGTVGRILAAQRLKGR